MIDTRKMTLLELHKISSVPMWKLTDDSRKAGRVLERRCNEWLKANPEKSYDDWYDLWYPGGSKAWNDELIKAVIGLGNNWELSADDKKLLDTIMEQSKIVL